MTNGILTLFDPDMYDTGTLSDVGVVPSVFPIGTGTIGAASVIGGLEVIRPQVFFSANPSAGGYGLSAFVEAMGFTATFGFFPSYPSIPQNGESGGIVVTHSQGAGSFVRVLGQSAVTLTRVPGAPANPVDGHIEVRLAYTVPGVDLIDWTAEVYLDGVLTYEGSATNVPFDDAVLSTLRAGIASTVSQGMKHIVYYDTDVLTQPLGITKVRQILTNATDLNPPPDDNTGITVLPAGVNLTLDDTDLGNVLAGGLVLRATPNTQGEVAELQAVLTGNDDVTQEAFTTETLPLFSYGSYYFPLSTLSGSDLYGGTLNLKSVEPE